MEQELISLLCICAIAFACPVLSALIPNKLIPETVFLLLFGMLLGPNVADVIITEQAIDLLSDLGLAFLFLLAGYEIEPKQLTGKQGQHGLIVWIITFALALATVIVWPGFLDSELLHLAIAICLTTTAYGTIVPILHERSLTGTRIGQAVVSYGAWGELCPVIAMALLLTSRSIWVTGVVLLAFAAIAICCALIPRKLQAVSGKLAGFMHKNAETNSQMTVRGVVMLLVGLVCVSAVFGLDIVLGAFAAGFALRMIIPNGDDSTERKLQGIGYGFFIPLFFVVSGAKIDPSAILDDPLMLLGFCVMLLLYRMLPIYIGLSAFKESRDMTPREKVTISLYCTTALPLIVAATTVATSAGAMDQSTASVLVAAGAATVLVMPFLASVALHTADAEIGSAVKEVVRHPKQVVPILKRHRELEVSKRKDMNHVLTRSAYKRKR